MRKRAETRQVEEAASTPDRVDESGEPVQQLRLGRIERQPIEVTVEGGDTADRLGQKFLKQIVHCPDNTCHARLPILRCIRSEEHTSELQSLMRIAYAVFSFKNNTQQ